MVTALTLLLLCQLVGEVLVRALAVPIPGPVIGMVILFTGLVVRGSVPTEVDRVATTLLRHLSLLFVPAGVGVIAYLGLIGTQALPLALALGPATLLTIAVTGWTAQRLADRGVADEDS